MKPKYIDFNKENKYLTEVLPMIPTNTILNKTLTGLGATYGELKAERHSIIIEPNVPVIVGKIKDPKHKNAFGVYEGIYSDDIVAYLEKNKGYHKILTTPESFNKVRDAFFEVGINIYEECFLLFDECERIIQDVCYRQDIALPIDDFFRFENKAMVSATPLRFSDPRFEKDGFKVLEIKPTFDYKRELYLFFTNNILKGLRDEVLKLLSQRRKEQGNEKDICIFLNSTDSIYAIINQLGIEKESAVFCSSKSVSKLKERKFNQAHDQWAAKRMKKYNFFTSRFYSAVDIEVEDTVDLIMISDIHYAEHSMIDPNTEATQIIGRFRNGVDSVFHITNLNENIVIKTKEDIEMYLKCSEDIYFKIKNLHDTTDNIFYKQAFSEAMVVIPYSKFINEDGTKDYFSIDNYIDEEIIKSYYNKPELLKNAYLNSNRFNMFYKSYFCPLSDKDRLKRERNKDALKKKNEETLRQLILLSENETEYESSIIQEYRNELFIYNSFIVEAFELLGADKIKELNYSRPKIREAMLLKQHQDGISGLAFQKAIDNSLRVNSVYTKAFIKKELNRLYTLFGIKLKGKITAETIRIYFEPHPAKKGGQQAFKLVARK